MRRAPAVRVAGALLAAVLAGCGGQERGTIPPGDAPERPSDGLLARPDLQAVVDLQVARDTAGLVAALADADPAVRARAAFALGSVQAPRAVPALLTRMEEVDHPAVRRDAAFALGQAGVPDVVGPLASALAVEDDPPVRFRILEALGKTGTPEAAEALLAADVRDGEEARRSLSLARLLAVHGVRHRPAQDHLLARLRDPDPAVRAVAAYYPGRQPEPGEWAPRAADLRTALDGYAPDDPAAMHLVQALGRLSDPTDTERLGRWARQGGDWRTRANAVTALMGRESDPAVREVLFDGLDDPSVHVAGTSAQLLARATHPPSDVLRVRTWVEEHPDRVVAVGPLMTLLARHDEREFVFDWIDGTPLDEEVRWTAAIVALSLTSGQAAVDRLERATRAPSDVLAARAVGALVQRWSRERGDPSTHRRYFEIFRAVTVDGPGRAALQAAPALADSAFTAFGRVETLTDAFGGMTAPDDRDAMIAVLAALGLTGDPAAEPVLRDALDHPDEAVRGAAATTLSRLTGQTVRPAGPTGPDPGGATASSTSGGDPGAGDPDPGVLDWTYLAALGPHPRLVLDTDRGRVVVRLVTEEAPHTVQTVARIAEAGHYDGVAFHRVVPNFVVQGGDFTRRDGNGGPGYSITSEFTLLTFERGVMGMASAGKDTEGSQFFLTHVATPHLDGGYTAFGRVVEGMDIVDALFQGSRVRTARIERDG